MSGDTETTPPMGVLDDDHKHAGWLARRGDRLRAAAENVSVCWALVKVTNGRAGKEGEALAKALDGLAVVLDETGEAEDAEVIGPAPPDVEPTTDNYGPDGSGGW